MDVLTMEVHADRSVTPICDAQPRVLVPWNLTLDRAWRWCIQATLRDQRVAAMRRREASWPNLRRLFQRRWAEMCRLYEIAEDSDERASLMQAGLAALSAGSIRELGKKRQVIARAA